jgi:DNA-binding NarL/FixJ family response regulator
VPLAAPSSLAVVGMTNYSPSSNAINVLLADSKQMENQLLAGSLKERGFQVLTCASELPPILELFECELPDVAVISCAAVYSVAPDMAVLRTLHFMYPRVPKVCLMDTGSPELAVQAFRSGARGLFCLADSSFQSLCECIQRVHRGEIFATNQQLRYLLDSVCQLPSLRVVGAAGEILLTSREEQVVALVTDGLSNRDVANELGLSEHTVKKYLFRIFEKLGISSRVELVLYALHHGSPQMAGWGARA